MDLLDQLEESFGNVKAVRLKVDGVKLAAAGVQGEVAESSKLQSGDTDLSCGR